MVLGKKLRNLYFSILSILLVVAWTSSSWAIMETVETRGNLNADAYLGKSNGFFGNLLPNGVAEITKAANDAEDANPQYIVIYSRSNDTGGSRFIGWKNPNFSWSRSTGDENPAIINWPGNGATQVRSTGGYEGVRYIWFLDASGNLGITQVRELNGIQHWNMRVYDPALAPNIGPPNVGAGGTLSQLPSGGPTGQETMNFYKCAKSGHGYTNPGCDNFPQGAIAAVGGGKLKIGVYAEQYVRWQNKTTTPVEFDWFSYRLLATANVGNLFSQKTVLTSSINHGYTVYGMERESPDSTFWSLKAYHAPGSMDTYIGTEMAPPEAEWEITPIPANSTFTNHKIPMTAPTAVAMPSGGTHFYVAANNTALSKPVLFRLSATDGSLDTSFGVNGYVVMDHLPAKIELAANKITLFRGVHGILRLTMNGTPDTNFGNGAGYLPGAIRDGVVENDGRIVALKDTYENQIVRYSNGLTDASLSISCPQDSLVQGESAVCEGVFLMTGSSEKVKYQWSVIGGGARLENATERHVTVIPTGASGTTRLALRVSSDKYPDKFWDASTGDIPLTGVTLSNLSCPYKINMGLTYGCSIQAEGPQGKELRYTWSTTRGEITSGQGTPSISVTAATSGPDMVKVEVFANGASPEAITIGQTAAAGALQDTEPWLLAPGIHMPAGGPSTGNGWITRFNYHAANTSRFRFVLTEAPGWDGTTRLMWVSGIISAPSELGMSTYTPDDPVPVKEGWRLGIITEDNVYPFTYNQSAGSKLARVGSDFGVGALLPLEADLSNRMPSFGAEGVTALAREAGASKSQNVTVVAPSIPTLTLEGPKTFPERTTQRFTAKTDANLSGQTLAIVWDVKGVTYSGANVDIFFPDAGKYDIIVTAYPEGHADLERKATLSALSKEVTAPRMSIIAPRTGEVGNPMTLTAKAPIGYGKMVIEWSMPDGTVVSGAEATYTPKVEDIGDRSIQVQSYPEGYIDRASTNVVKVKIFQYAFPAFTLRNFVQKTGMAPHKVTYAAEANLRDVTEKFSYSWDMGNGATMPNSSKVNATYTEPGEYTVRMTVSDTRGNSSVVEDTVTVTTVPPIAVDSFTVTGSNKLMKAPVTGMFKPTVSGGNPRVDKFTTYTWTVNGQTVGRNSNRLSYKFEEPGTYAVGLMVTSKNGLTGGGATTVVITPNEPPECTISYEDYPSKKYTKLIGNCADPDGRIKEMNWDLGDGTKSRSKTVSKKYADSGTYTVTLTATDDSDEQVTVSKEIIVSR
ncbi:MAG: PKD domain-containing protein [Syntrophus sp. (in: bacteria)]